jgi:fructan beta-fructosidase
MNTDSGPRLASIPVDAQSLHDGIAEIHELKQLDGQEQLNTTGVLREVWLEADLGNISASELGIKLSNSKGEFVTMGYDLVSKQYFFNRTNSGKKDFEPGFASRYYAPKMLADNKIRIHLLQDVASAEVFADDGLTTLTNIFFPNEDYQRLSVYAKGGEAKDILVKIQPLKPALPH